VSERRNGCDEESKKVNQIWLTKEKKEEEVEQTSDGVMGDRAGIH